MKGIVSGDKSHFLRQESAHIPGIPPPHIAFSGAAIRKTPGAAQPLRAIISIAFLLIHRRRAGAAQ